MLDKDKRDYLKSIYFDAKNPASFSGVSKVWKLIKSDGKVSRKELEQWLLEQDTYTSYFPVNRKFRRPKTISPYVDAIWGSDVAYMLAFADSNEQYSYFCVFIDLFSLYAWASPLKTLKGLEMVKVLKELFTDAKCERLFTDSGSEYKNRWVERYLKSEDVKHYTSKNETKVAHAERLIKTIKRKLLQYMNETNTHIWHTVLQDMIYAYNHSVSRRLKMTPAQARQASQYTVWANRYFTKPKRKAASVKKPKNTTAFNIKLGDRVKVLTLKRPFDREYDEKYTSEVFTVTDRRVKEGVPSYSIKDEQGDPITGNRHLSLLCYLLSRLLYLNIFVTVFAPVHLCNLFCRMVVRQ